MSTTYPREGDVLVTLESRSPESYTVRQLPAALQLRASSRADGLQVARAFAQAHAVDVWYCEDGAYSLLEAHRPLTSAHADGPQAAE